MKTTDKTAEFLDEYEVLCRRYNLVLEYPHDDAYVVEKKSDFTRNGLDAYFSDLRRMNSQKQH